MQIQTRHLNTDDPQPISNLLRISCYLRATVQTVMDDNNLLLGKCDIAVDDQDNGNFDVACSINNQDSCYGRLDKYR